MLVAVIVTIAANGWMMTRTLGGIMFFLYFLFVLQDLLLLHLLLSYLLTYYLLTYFLFVLQDLLRNFLGCSGGGGGTC